MVGGWEQPNLSAGCMSNAFRRRERNALPFSHGGDVLFPTALMPWQGCFFPHGGDALLPMAGMLFSPGRGCLTSLPRRCVDYLCRQHKFDQQLVGAVQNGRANRRGLSKCRHGFRRWPHPVMFGLPWRTPRASLASDRPGYARPVGLWGLCTSTAMF